MKPVIVTAAICGAEVFKTDTPYIPYTTEELAAEAEKCISEGASIIHLHVREDDGTPTQDRETFDRAIKAIRERVGHTPIVQVSTGGAVGMTVDERCQPLELRPDMATLTTGTVNFGTDVFLNSQDTIEGILQRIQANGVVPEIEVFDSGMMDNAARMVKRGLLEWPLHYDFVLGVPGGMGGTPDRLDFLRTLLPEGCTWTVAGVGRYELPLAQKAIAEGGNVRVGLEDNVFIRKGVLAQGSWELVREVVSMAKDAGRPLATPEQARNILALPPTAGA
jgi:3-keto-5-aminohexanoate cleavage enzyme